MYKGGKEMQNIFLCGHDISLEESSCIVYNVTLGRWVLYKRANMEPGVFIQEVWGVIDRNEAWVDRSSTVGQFAIVFII